MRLTEITLVSLIKSGSIRKKMNEEVNLSENKTDYSIKSKILISLIAIPFIMLTLFLLWSLELFQKDKIAYIFDSTWKNVYWGYYKERFAY